MPNDTTAVFPPAATIFRRRSLAESSLTIPTCVHPAAMDASVLRRTRIM
jgi:hypothetical protein